MMDSLERLALLDQYENDKELQGLVRRNFGILKCIRGGLRMAERNRLDFDPRKEYWHPPERRLAVAYLADHWTGRFAPAASLRSFALELLAWFDKARPSVVSFVGVDYDRIDGGLAKICADLGEHARRMPPTPAWDQLRKMWAGSPSRLASSAGADVASFLEEAAQADNFDGGFKQRLPWFGYLGVASEQDLRRHQSFFYGYANLWTSTPAYAGGGSVNFAPVIQNTPTSVMLDSASTWASSQATAPPTFSVWGRDDVEPQDRSRYTLVSEIYGFLTVQHAPPYITSSRSYRDWFNIPDTIDDPYEETARVGEITRSWLSQHPDMVHRLDRLFRELVSEPVNSPVELETIDSPRVKKIVPADNVLWDHELQAELEQTAMEELTNATPQAGASVALHLLLACKAFLDRAVAGTSPSRNVAQVTTPPEAADSTMFLPEELRSQAERALAYLKAGLHVVFAGAPGTGKTTLAQFVGYAWDHALDSLPAQLSMKDAPLTTVGNSAWSPFHTIGGLMPTGAGTFRSYPGIFIDPLSTNGDSWRLRDGALVLDEMNRADLDRCIGELYPLLSGSVRRVWPAGLPGVMSIDANDRFRVIATINDANLDDIVFPISEGLSRRFQRIELRGGSRDDVLTFVGVDGPSMDGDPRRLAVFEAVSNFFEVAREAKLLIKDEDDERLPFGVAYFTLLREWVAKRLTLPESTPSEQARELVADSLRSLARSRTWRDVLQAFLAKA